MSATGRHCLFPAISPGPHERSSLFQEVKVGRERLGKCPPAPSRILTPGFTHGQPRTCMWQASMPPRRQHFRTGMSCGFDRHTRRVRRITTFATREYGEGSPALGIADPAPGRRWRRLTASDRRLPDIHRRRGCSADRTSPAGIFRRPAGLLRLRLPALLILDPLRQRVLVPAHHVGILDHLGIVA